jgi:hypothetical protein
MSTKIALVVSVIVLVAVVAQVIVASSRATSAMEDTYLNYAQNLAEDMDLDCIWTANHVTRNAYKHRKTRYEENDIAKCVDIVRNSVAIFGLNCTEQEEKDGIQRLELVVMRDGKPNGRALYKVDIERQRAVEFTRDQRKKYDELYSETIDNEIKKQAAETNKQQLTGDI